MPITIVTDLAQAGDVMQRIVAGMGIAPTLVGDDPFADNAIIAIDTADAASVMRTVRCPNGVWYVQHLWGGVRSWLPLIAATARELRRMGYGQAPVRWQNLSDRPRLNQSVAPIQVRQALDDETAKTMWEITADEAWAFLSSFREG